MSDHYVVELNIKSVRKPAPVAPGRPYAEVPNAGTSAGERVIEDVARLVVKGSTLEDLVSQTKKHLDTISEGSEDVG